jgi:hypothetical protein
MDAGTFARLVDEAPDATFYCYVTKERFFCLPGNRLSVDEPNKTVEYTEKGGGRHVWDIDKIVEVRIGPAKRPVVRIPSKSRSRSR